jgi:Na+-driven multidrug efflux pump
MAAQVICTALHALWCHFFIIKFGLQIYGAGYAMALTCVIEFIAVTLLSHRVKEI